MSHRLSSPRRHRARTTVAFLAALLLLLSIPGAGAHAGTGTMPVYRWSDSAFGSGSAGFRWTPATGQPAPEPPAPQPPAPPAVGTPTAPPSGVIVVRVTIGSQTYSWASDGNVSRVWPPPSAGTPPAPAPQPPAPPAEPPAPPAEPPAPPAEPPAPPAEPPAPPSEPPPAPQPPAPTPDDGFAARDPAQVRGVQPSAEELKMVALVNQARADAGLPPLVIDPRLVELARMKARDMVEQGYFGHTSPTYGSPFAMMRAAGIKYVRAGENLAGAATVERAHTNLMNSDGHRRNILSSNYTRVGIGIYPGRPYGLYIVQLFIQD